MVYFKLIALAMVVIAVANAFQNDVHNFVSGITHIHHHLDALKNELRSKGARPDHGSIVHYVTDVDNNIDNLIGIVGNSLPSTGPGTPDMVKSILEPTFKSISEGAEILVSDTVGGYVDPNLSPIMQQYSQSLSKVANLAGVYNLRRDQKMLTIMSHHVELLIRDSYHHHDHHDHHDYHDHNGGEISARQAAGILDGFISGMDNARQRFDAFTNDLRQKGSRPGAALAVNLIAGLDGQIDNILGVLDDVLGKLTFGLTNPIFGFILGPTFQSLTDGIEVLIGNLVGGIIDLPLVPILRGLSNSLVRVSNVADRFDMNDISMKLQMQTQQINDILAKQGK